MVEAQSPESLIRVTLDIPKEGVFAIQSINPMDKRDTLMSFVNNESNRFYERSNLELEKRKFHIDFEREEKYVSSKKGSDWGSWISSIFGVIGGAITTAAGIALMLTGGGAVPGAALAAGGLSMLGGMGGAAVQGASIGYKHREEDEERADRLRHANENFRLRGEQMHIQHQEAERQEMIQIRNMANSNTYGNTTHAINYQGFNEHYGTTDIHLAHYRPTGDVLKRLKWYYQEYGYDLMVPDQVCHGISTIKGHIRFSQIQENRSSTNQTIRALIEGRLLAGVRVVDLEGKPIGPDEYPLTILYESCITRYDELRDQHEQLTRERAELAKERDRLNKEIETHQGTIVEKDRVITDRETQLANQVKELEEKNKAIEVKDREITNKVTELNKALENLKNLEQSKEAEIKAKEEELKQRAEKIKEMEGQLKESEEKIAEYDKALNECTTENRAKLRDMALKLQDLLTNQAKKQKECEDAKKQLEDASFKLREEVEKHEEDKRELTQKLNDERRALLNKTDEANRLSKEKGELEKANEELTTAKTQLESTKNQLESDIAGLQQDLKTATDKSKFTKSLCQFVKEMAFDSRYEIDMKERKSGLSAFTDIAFELVHNYK